jgi:nitroreductase
MDTLNCILSRRSIRNYSDKKIPSETINCLLKAAMYAPSAFNQQPWEFIVIDDKNVFNSIIKAVPYTEMIKEASHVIIACGNLSIDKNIEFILQDCSAAIQNILLAAHNEGIGSCWIASAGIGETVDALKNLFILPDSIFPVAIISLGYPAETPAAEDRYLTSKIHNNKW